MHEMSLAEGILQLVEETARRERATQVKTIVVEIGQLSCVAPEALKFCFDSVSRGSMAEGAKLEIIDIAGSAYCSHCAAHVPMFERYDACPNCGKHPLQAINGTEMRVREIEIASSA